MKGLQTFYVVYRNLELGIEATMTVEAHGEETARQRVLHDIRDEEGETVEIVYIGRAPHDFDVSPTELAMSITAQREHSFQRTQRVFWNAQEEDQRGIYRVTGVKGTDAYLERKGLIDAETHIASMKDLFLLQSV